MYYNYYNTPSCILYYRLADTARGCYDPTGGVIMADKALRCVQVGWLLVPKIGSGGGSLDYRFVFVSFRNIGIYTANESKIPGRNGTKTLFYSFMVPELMDR